MPPFQPTMTYQQIMSRLMDSLHVNQTGLARLLGVSTRTVARHWRGGGVLLPSTAEQLARAAHPHDRALAVELAGRAGKTLVQLGLEAPPAPAAPAAPAPERAPRALHRHVVDAVVSVAAEALQSPPQAVRAAVLAAFDRATALGMSAEDVVAALTPPRAAKSSPK